MIILEHLELYYIKSASRYKLRCALYIDITFSIIMQEIVEKTYIHFLFTGIYKYTSVLPNHDEIANVNEVNKLCNETLEACADYIKTCSVYK